MQMHPAHAQNLSQLWSNGNEGVLINIETGFVEILDKVGKTCLYSLTIDSFCNIINVYSLNMRLNHVFKV